MPRLVPETNDVAVYLVVNDSGCIVRAFVETDVAEADRETVIRDFLSGQYSNARRVVAFNIAEGWSRDVSEEIAWEVIDRTFDADDTLSENTKRFIDRFVTQGEKRPPAPSVRRESIPGSGKKRAWPKRIHSVEALTSAAGGSAWRPSSLGIAVPDTSHSAAQNKNSASKRR